MEPLALTLTTKLTKQRTQLLPYDSFFSKLPNINPLEKDYNDFENLTTGSFSSEQVVCKSRLNKIPPTGDENYACLRRIWVNKGKKSFRDFLMWHNNEDVVSTLEAMQKMIEFYHQKEIAKLNMVCTLHNLAKTCLHKSTDSKFHPFTETTKTCWRRFVKAWFLVPPLSLHAKLWLTKLLSANQRICTSQLSAKTQANSVRIPYSLCQPMPTGLYARWNYDSESQKFIPRQNKTRSFENMVLAFFQKNSSGM